MSKVWLKLVLIKKNSMKVHRELFLSSYLYFSSKNIWLCCLGYRCYKPFKGQLIAEAPPCANDSALPLHFFLSPSASEVLASSCWCLNSSSLLGPVFQVSAWTDSTQTFSFFNLRVREGSICSRTENKVQAHMWAKRLLLAACHWQTPHFQCL